MKKVCITGAAGLLGNQLVYDLGSRGFDVVPLTRNGLYDFPGVDLSDREAVGSFLDQYKPDTIIHAAAMSDPAECENNKDRARLVNVGSTSDLANWARNNTAYFIFISTDLLFNGKKSMYTEDDLPSPLSFYGETKLEAEERIVEILGSSSLILRLTLMLGRSPSGKRGLDERLISEWKQKRKTKLFTDEIRTPIHVRTASKKIIELGDKNKTGIIHVAGHERLSRLEIGQIVAKVYGYSTDWIEAVSLADYRSHPPRPRDVSLDIAKMNDMLQSDFHSLESVLKRDR